MTSLLRGLSWLCCLVASWHPVYFSMMALTVYSVIIVCLASVSPLNCELPKKRSLTRGYCSINIFNWMNEWIQETYHIGIGLEGWEEFSMKLGTGFPGSGKSSGQAQYCGREYCLQERGSLEGLQVLASEAKMIGKSPLFKRGITAGKVTENNASHCFIISWNWL